MSSRIPQSSLAANTTSLRFTPTMGNLFGGLSFNLTRVTAERPPGISFHDCWNHPGSRKQTLTLHLNVENIFHKPTSQLTVALTLQHLFGFPERKHASCFSLTFDSLWAETAHQVAYYVLQKKLFRDSKDQKGKQNPPRRHCLEIDSCYCAVPSGAFAM